MIRDRDGVEWVLVPKVPINTMLAAGGFYCIQGADAVSEADKKQAGRVYAAAIAAAPQFETVEVTDDLCNSAWLRRHAVGPSISETETTIARNWLAAWRAELGPTLGMVPDARADARIAELVDALDCLTLVVGLTAFKHESQRAPLQEAMDKARSAIAARAGNGESGDAGG